jgi:hypothetical protein
MCVAPVLSLGRTRSKRSRVGLDRGTNVSVTLNNQQRVTPGYVVDLTPQTHNDRDERTEIIEASPRDEENDND